MIMRFTILYSFCICFVGNAGGKILQVGRSHAFKSITAALTAAKSNDTIYVEAGVYREHNIIISKPVVLIGKGMPVLDGERKYENISIKADGVVIDGFKVINSGISSIVDYGGIKIYNRRNVVIVNNVILDCFFGIYTQYGINCVIKNNTLSAHQVQEQHSGNGIHCWKSDSMQIIGNKVSGHRDGIYFEFVTNSLIRKNSSIKNLRYGLHFMFSNNDTYSENIFENNGAGVAVMFSNHVRMFRNYFSKNWGDAAYGILLKEISDSHIEGNRFEFNTSGIYMEGASRIEVYKNSFKENGWALKIQASCMDITLRNNNFIGNTFDVGTNGSLVLNKFENNYWDKYEGYDLNKDKIGDIPYRPVSMYSMVIEKNPPAMMLFHSLITTLLDKSEKVIPSLTPADLVDKHPLMKALSL
ncbi:MAG: Periplasmic copper-binding protein (NosD) [Flavipsychrobacter sp.]|jgi:nitrous oxidase accessory protein|nr:Periplasmic copper-binding protein (NosD) [Flavipsychrobacter sp.]